MHRWIVSQLSTIRESYRQWLNRFSRYFLWWQKSGNKVSLKSENLPNSPNKMSDKCYGMKFDLFDDQLLLKRHPTAQFNRWAKMGVVCNHVRCCFKRFKSVHTQATVLQSCQLKLLTLNLFKRCATKQLRFNFIDNSRVMLQKKTKWRMLWRKWINLRTFWGSSNSSSSSNTLMSAAETTMFYYYTIQH